MDQSKISRLERRSDMLLSTLKRFVQATDGEMHLGVTYPDGGPVELLTFSPWSPAVSRAARTFSPNSSASSAAALVSSKLARSAATSPRFGSGLWGELQPDPGLEAASFCPLLPSRRFDVGPWLVELRGDALEYLEHVGEFFALFGRGGGRAGSSLSSCSFASSAVRRSAGSSRRVVA